MTAPLEVVARLVEDTAAGLGMTREAAAQALNRALTEPVTEPLAAMGPRSIVLAMELQAACEEVAVHLANTKPDDDQGEEYRRRADRRDAAFRAVVEAIEGASA